MYLKKLIENYLVQSHKSFRWFPDVPIIYAARIFRWIFKSGQKNKLYNYKFNIRQRMPSCAKKYFKEILKTPSLIMTTSWKLSCINTESYYEFIYVLVRLTSGSVIEIGRDRGRSLAQITTALSFDNDEKRRVVSIDPVKLDLLDNDFVSPECANIPYVNNALSQEYLPDDYASIFVRRRNYMQIVTGYSYEEEVLNYTSTFGPFELLILDAYSANEDGTYEAVKKDVVLYKNLIRKGGYIFIINAFDSRFEIHRFLAEVINGQHISEEKYCQIESRYKGIFVNKNICILRKESGDQ